MKIVAVVPAFRNEDTIQTAVRALLADGRVDQVLVVDDGSGDSTPDLAEAAGATVFRLPRNEGKHAPLRRGMAEARDAAIILMVDADTAGSAPAVIDLVEPIKEGMADMVVGLLPSAGKSGGFGIVRDFAGWCIKASSGYSAAAPLSGQRALRREVFEKCGLRGYGYAVDARLTSDAVRAGFKVVEQPVDMTHDHKGRRLAGFLHRGRQGWHVVRTFSRPVIGGLLFRRRRS